MKLSNRPCPTCNEDTLHVGPKCNKCGTITLKPTYSQFLRRQFAGPRRLATILAQRRASSEGNREASVTRIGYSDEGAPKQSSAIFGRRPGRGRLYGTNS